MARKSNYDPWKASKIKVLNERQAEIKRKFPHNPSLYEEYHNALVLAVGPENINASGNIKRGPAVYAKLDEDTINTLLRHQTAGQIKKAAQREAKEQSEITGQHVTMEDVLEAKEAVYDIINDDSDLAYEAFKFYWESVGGKGHAKPTYIQVNDIAQTLSAQRRSGVDINPFTGEADTSNIEDKLRKRIKAQNERREAGMLASYFPEA